MRKRVGWLVIVSFCGCAATDAERGAHDARGREATTGDQAAGRPGRDVPLPGLDHGLLQSPIDIDTRRTTDEGAHRVTLHFEDAVDAIENLGHTVQLDFAEGSTITADGVTFGFKQCHFHTPSEHHIDGVGFPLEMHIVNVEPGTPADDPQYLVIAVLFREGAPNRFLADFLDAIPAHANERADARGVRLAHLFGTIPDEITGGYYFYRGSLTTPPYTESVRWYVAKRLFEASPEQIARLGAIEGQNARHVQALYGRTVESE